MYYLVHDPESATDAYFYANNLKWSFWYTTIPEALAANAHALDMTIYKSIEDLCETHDYVILQSSKNPITAATNPELFV